MKRSLGWSSSAHVDSGVWAVGEEIQPNQNLKRSVWFQPSAAGEEANGTQVQHMSSSETQVNPPSDVCSQEPDDAEGLQLLLKGTFSACWGQEPETSLIGTDASPGWAEAPPLNNQIS